MIVREVQHGSTEYRQLVDLRRRVLRVPLGLDFTKEELEREAGQRHFGLYAGEGNSRTGNREPVLGRRSERANREPADLPKSVPGSRSPNSPLLATCAAVPLPDGSWKIRQVAVEPDEQGKGYGAALMRAMEERTSEIVLHARDTAVPFYLRLGYEIEGEPFEEVGISHRKMRKRVGTEPEPVSS